MYAPSLLIKYLCFSFLILLSSETFAQTTDSLKYKFNLQLGGQRRTGIFSQTSVRLSSSIKLENKLFLFDNQISYTYTDANGFNIADNWNVRTVVLFKPDSAAVFMPAIGHRFLKNVLYRINSSHKALAGLRVYPIRSYRGFSFLVGAGYEISNYTNEIFLNSASVANQRNFALGVLNVFGRHQLWKNRLVIEYNIVFNQSFREAQDFVFWVEAGISIPLGKTFSIGVNYDYRFRNVHLEDIPSVNDLLLFNLRCNFSN